MPDDRPIAAQQEVIVKTETEISPIQLVAADPLPTSESAEALPIVAIPVALDLPNSEPAATAADATPVLLAGSPGDDEVYDRESLPSWWRSAATVVLLSLGVLPFSSRWRYRREETEPPTVKTKDDHS